MKTQTKSSLIFLISLKLNLIVINSESFCVNPKVYSAFTINDKTFLIRDDKVWYFDAIHKLVSKESTQLKDFIIDKRLGAVDTIFASSDALVYVFWKGGYFFYKPMETGNPSLPINLVHLTNEDNNKVPEKWSRFGNLFLGPLGNGWFPKNIDEAVVVKKTDVYLFNGNSIRYAKMSYNWPEGPKFDFPFAGPLKGLSKIDATFSLPSTMDPLNKFVVITVGLKYCIFKITEINITKDIIKSCLLRDSFNYFGCNKQNNTPSTQISDSSTSSFTTVSVDTENTYHNSSESQSSESVTSMDGIITSNESKSTHTTINIDYGDEDSEGSVKKSGSKILIIIVIIVVVVFVIIIAISGVIIVIKRKPKETSSTNSKGKSKKQDRSGHKPEKSNSTIMTIHSVTGNKVVQKSKKV